MQSTRALLYCHLWPARLCNIFPHYLVNGTTSVKNLWNIKFVFWFSLQILYKIFHILWISDRDMIVNVCWSSSKVPVILVRFFKLEFSVQFFEKYWNIKFHENPSSGSHVVPFGWAGERVDGQTETDRHAEANSRFVRGRKLRGGKLVRDAEQKA
jgi:hypothetical protein